MIILCIDPLVADSSVPLRLHPATVPVQEWSNCTVAKQACSKM